MSVNTIVADHLGKTIEECSDDKSLVDDLGADSLDTVEIILQLEEQYDVEIADEDAETLSTIGLIKEYIEVNS